MGLELERREAMKEAWVGCEGCCSCSGSLRREREDAKAWFAVDERAREEYLWGVRRWRRVCWRRVRMHDVQTVEEDMLCVLVYSIGGGKLVAVIVFLLLANSLDGQVQWD
jgi:hypothetical protein